MSRGKESSRGLPLAIKQSILEVIYPSPLTRTSCTAPPSQFNELSACYVLERQRSADICQTALMLTSVKPSSSSCHKTRRAEMALPGLVWQPRGQVCLLVLGPSLMALVYCHSSKYVLPRQHPKGSLNLQECVHSYRCLFVRNCPSSNIPHMSSQLLLARVGSIGYSQLQGRLGKQNIRRV